MSTISKNQQALLRRTRLQNRQSSSNASREVEPREVFTPSSSLDNGFLVKDREPSGLEPEMVRCWDYDCAMMARERYWRQQG